MSLGQKINLLLRSSGYQLRPLRDFYAYRRNEIMRSSGIDLVIDVGANSGQYGEEIRRFGYHGRICSFEPLSAPYRQLAALAARDGNWTAVHGALGESKATLQINVSANSASSSLLPMRESHVQAAPHSQYVGTEEVSVGRLDQEWDRLQPHSDNVLLKLDTQGYEAMVLRGASGVLPHIKLIDCELSMVALYDGQMLLIQMLNLLEQLGFEPVDFTPIFFDPKSGRCLQLDGLFAKKQSPRDQVA